RVRSGHRDGLFWLVISLRTQGRLGEALSLAKRLRSDAPSDLLPGSAPYDASSAAQVMFELGDFHAAGALFDSIAHARSLSLEESAIPRPRGWFLTHAGGAWAAGGDTARLSALVDTMQAFGARSGSGRDQRLYHHVRGLLFAARGRHAEASQEFRLAIYSPTQGFTRSNLELGRALLALGKPREAV